MTTHYDRDTLIDYLHGEMTAADDAAIHAHVAACGDCRTLRDEESALGDLLRAAAAADERELPSMVKAKIWDAVRREHGAQLEQLRCRWIGAFDLCERERPGRGDRLGMIGR